jgi:hypothetical protein
MKVESLSSEELKVLKNICFSEIAVLGMGYGFYKIKRKTKVTNILKELLVI